MKLVVKKRYLGYIWIFMAFLIPYIEIAAVRNLLEVKTGNMVIPAVFFVMLVIWAYLWCANRVNGYHKQQGFTHHLYRIDLGIFLLVLVCTFTAVLHDAKFHHYLQLFMVVLPYLFARECLLRIRGYGFTNREIAKYGITFFLICQLFLFVINIVLYGFSFNGEASNRILSVGGGPVILGYTVALVFAAWLVFRDTQSSKLHLFVCCSAFLVTFATGSRGGMWPILLLLIVGFMCRSGKLSSKRSLATLVVAFAVIAIVDFQALFPRLLLFSNESRLATVVDNLGVFTTQPFLEQLLGSGIGMFYPYQLWLSNSSLACFHNYNHFFYNGVSLLVQPHNIFVYVLMESGVLGLALFTFTIIKAISGKKTTKGKTTLVYKMFVITSFFLLFVEATFFVEPGSASLWWFILMLVGSCEEKCIQ